MPTTSRTRRADPHANAAPTPDGLSLTVVVGRLRHDAERRELASGSSVLSFDLAVAPDEGSVESIPVRWADPPAKVRLRADDVVVVVGRTRQRFFRVGGATASRTEVVAEVVVPRRRGDRFRTVLDEAVDRLTASVEALPPVAYAGSSDG